MNPAPQSPLAWISVLREDDYDRPEYPRPSILEIAEAHSALKELDAAGALPDKSGRHVRVLLSAVGRLSAGGLAEAFPPPGLKAVR